MSSRNRELLSLLKLTEENLTPEEIDALWLSLQHSNNAHVAAEMVLNHPATSISTMIRVVSSSVKTPKQVKAAAEKIINQHIEESISEIL